MALSKPDGTETINTNFRNSPPLDTNTFDIGPIKFWALGDRILIREDEFKTGYECSTCGGSGQVRCDNCHGQGHNNGKKCSWCNGKAEVRCPACEGKGGLLVAPDIAQRRPTTGKVVSVGDDVTHVKVGDSVLYSNFAGFVVDLAPAGKKVTLRILHEPEILCGMEGQLEMRTLRGKTEIATFS